MRILIPLLLPIIERRHGHFGVLGVVAEVSGRKGGIFNLLKLAIDFGLMHPSVC